jgi:hypothetical protein
LEAEGPMSELDAIKVNIFLRILACYVKVFFILPMVQMIGWITCSLALIFALL